MQGHFAPQPGDAGRADDGAGALRAHHRCGVLDAEEDPAQQHAHRLVEFLDRDPGDRAGGAAEASAYRTGAEAAGMAARQLHQQVQFSAARLEMVVLCEGRIS